MIQELKKILIKWNDTSDDRRKVQTSFILLGVATFVIAGLFSLINHFIGSVLMYAGLVFFGIALSNFIAWALLKTAVFDRLPKPTTKKQKK